MNLSMDGNQRLVAAARRYTGVPFRHRGRSNRGLDCAGLVWIAYRDCGLELPDNARYGREPHRDGLVTHCRVALGEEIATPPVNSARLEPGDVLVMRFEFEPHHMAIVTRHPLGHLAILHADGDRGQLSCVLEHGLSADMVSRITHVFRRPV